MVKTTRAQREALFRKWRELESPRRLLLSPDIRGNPKSAMMYADPNYKEFRKTVQPCFDGSGCIMVKWCGMWLGIETDGYTHS